MKEKEYKWLWIAAVIVIFIAITPLAYLGANIILNSLVLHRMATTNDYTNFWGGIIGSLIGCIVTVVVLFVTIRSNNQKQKEQIELQNSLQKEDANLQLALKAEDNLNRKMEVERKIISEAYNHLDKFTTTSRYFTVNDDDFSKVQIELSNLHGSFLSSVNLLRFNSEIFHDKSRCEGCESCSIKAYGLLAKDSMSIQKVITSLEKDCQTTFTYFYIMLSIANECKVLRDTNTNLQRMSANIERIIELQTQLLESPLHEDKAAINRNILNYRSELHGNSIKISDNQRQFDDKIKLIAENRTLAQNKVQEIYDIQVGKFAQSIYKYFDTYSLYIKESVYATQQKGKKFNNSCPKLDFEKNHGAKQVTK